MALTELFTGSEAVTTTEWSLTTDTAGPDTQTSDAVVQVFLDLNALVKGDKFELRAYEAQTGGGTQRRAWRATFRDVQTDPTWYTPWVSVLHGWDFTLIKIAGADETITWSIRGV